ncbi:Transaldolase [Mycena kentingensis (nom. inval.)]|nr:Transaldolase [Mycena kentingensis (nom. inval.)]
MAAPSALQTLRSFGIQIASDTAEFNQITEFADAGYISDATSNPSLIYAAVSKPEYAHLVWDAVAYAVAKKGRAPEREGRDGAGDGPPGCADPRLAYDTEGITAKAHSLVSLLAELGIPRHRVLIKIPATYEGILAAQRLESQSPPVHTNMTLVFGLVQAAACAQAGAKVISPFIGRVKDFWDTKLGRSSCTSLAKHPGILLVRAIRVLYAASSSKTPPEILAAGFRAPEEVIELGAYGREGGPDAVTIPPSLVAGLRDMQQKELKMRPLEAVGRPEPETQTRYFGDGVVNGAQAYARDISAEEIAAVKVPEGLLKFSMDAQKMEEMLRGRVVAAVGESVSAML